jgi:cation:H+ antiporter
MSSVTWVWLEFALCSALIGYAGLRLIHYGDALADLTGLSRNWIGLVLVATVTSLPELVTGLSAVSISKAPDIAAGDVLGSCVFNLAILALMDALYRKEPLFTVVNRDHVLPASLGILLLVSTGLILVLSKQGTVPNVGHVSTGSFVLMGLYVLSMKLLYQAEQRHHAPTPPVTSVMPLRKALMGYVMSAIVIVASGIWLPFLGVELAERMGWTSSFVGTLFVALATSIPELATTIGALRIGAVDMAVGNLLGSNLFDMLILALDDLAYVQGPLYEHISMLHLVSALTAAVMSTAVILALIHRPVSRVGHVCSWASLTLLAMYLLNAGYQFLHGR